MSGGTDYDISAEINKVTEKTDLISSGRIGIVADATVISIVVFVTFVILYINDDLAVILFRIRNVSDSLFFGIEIGARSIVESVAASGKVVTEKREFSIFLIDIECFGG